ncbi:intracellular sulfur oxidation DsrE/DsrF family protein [Catalinimonas alkaloidigena]|uniref:DsrE family protein n=1 Tax=Catalinimonas alkaloidigena TaxID=1075417 RepID=UPI002406B5FA|nr:DsrE family protein [Catalinimonas alkaloidigena]MDF9801232.1 intracellular sulfur oxidation DsrE/DsrF family protein [Catalinimonas alkaloidigena]
MIRSLILLLTLIAICFTSHAQIPQHPAVPTFGGIYDIPEADKRPDPDVEYKLVIDVKGGAEVAESENRSLINIARTLNLHVQGGVPQENIKIVAVIHNLATPTVLSNEAYQKHFGVDNPNDSLIHALTEAGVEIYVCGQSLIARNFADEPLHPDVKVSISAMTILTEYQLKGYALLSF